MSALSQLAQAALAAAATARGARPAVVERKAAQDFVTDMDKRLQHQIAVALKVSFPDVPSLGEEGIRDEECLPDRVFLIDPLDGTGNWIAGLPFSAVSIAYLENGKTMLAAVAGIEGDSLYTAEAGKGAWRDDTALRVGAVPDLMALSTGVLDALEKRDGFAALRRFGKLRNLGSQALQLCAVARSCLAFNASLEARLWDDAAGRLIATEAGACYRASVASSDIARPAARQRSLCAHPDVFDAVAAILTPIFNCEQS